MEMPFDGGVPVIGNHWSAKQGLRCFFSAGDFAQAKGLALS